MTTGVRKAGDFCWINMLTPQTEAARAFFGAVLGWTYAEIPGMGHRVVVGGQPIGALFDVVDSRQPGVIHEPVIGLMVKVDSADAAAEKVTSLGGTAKPAFDIKTAGRMAVCYDPGGANLDLWEPKTLQGTVVDTGRHGAPSWFEVPAVDLEVTARFYSALFGWTSEATPMSGLVYTTFKLDGAPVAGMVPASPEAGTTRPRWRTYFTVDDAGDAANQVVSLGGTISTPLRDVEGVGQVCGLTSPHGVPFHVVTYSR